MRKALLIIDRGSKELEVQDELLKISNQAKEKGGYIYSNFCFLEVIPPYIDEGIRNCIKENVDLITVMPYFLYPGMKLKDAVKKTAAISKDKQVKLVITKPLCYSDVLKFVIIDRLTKLKFLNDIRLKDKECDVLVIGHGSSDRRATEAFIFTINSIKNSYRNVEHCFLELEGPTIQEGINSVIKKNPKIVLIMPYFLHKGIHIKHDVINEVKIALKSHSFTNILIADHIGVDDNMVNLILLRANEVEKRIVYERND
ncbi:MAG TPA: CbiX/SirB N-terminal domain-containing protein [Nitrososphaeraceae archaeon]|jgi:sirohydrochlorin ferrochelatase|nr:CbiX/SirB N-terminal domain-containing protein [Nitrososphaeraceae archaeon]